VTRATRAASRRGPAKPDGPSRKPTAPAAGGLFSPPSQSLGLDQGAASPALLEKGTYAGTVARSFGQASVVLQTLADWPVPAKPVERVTERIGPERLAERQAARAAFPALPLASRFQAPQGVTPPALAVVLVAGGRMQVLERRPPTAGAAGAATPGPEPEWDEGPAAGRARGPWREDKVGLLLTLHSAVSGHDPCPDIPASFVDPLRIPRLARELKKAGKATAEAEAGGVEPAAVEEALRTAGHYEPPEVGPRQAVASLGPWRSFTPLVA
jgi:hypothetical protein